MPAHDPATHKHEELLKAIHDAAQLIASQVSASLIAIGRAYKPDAFPLTAQNAPATPVAAVSMPPLPDPAALHAQSEASLSSASASASSASMTLSNSSPSPSLTSTTLASAGPAPSLFTPVMAMKDGAPPAPGIHTPLTTLESDSKPSNPAPVVP